MTTRACAALLLFAIAVVSLDMPAAIDGMHGWFWRNRTPAPVTVTLRAAGAHTAWKEVR